MSLSISQLKAREGKLTASRVAVLMKGDAEGIMQLYLEMIGEGEPIDLRHVWPVRLGEATETLNLDWYEEKNGQTISRRGEVCVHPKHEWAACTLDGWIGDLECPIEVKHVGGREPLEVIIERYAAQTQWQMYCTYAEQCALSVIMGASEPVIEWLPRAQEYIDIMIERGLQFMQHVKNKTPPVALPAVAAPIDASKVYDMSGSNSWADSALTWLDTKEAADECKDAEKILKSLVPADAKKCSGHDIQITRDRAGRLSLRKAT
jgi:predicted phage-related endonuclease